MVHAHSLLTESQCSVQDLVQPFTLTQVRRANQLTLVFALHFLAFERFTRSLASFLHNVLYAFL